VVGVACSKPSIKPSTVYVPTVRLTPTAVGDATAESAEQPALRSDPAQRIAPVAGAPDQATPMLVWAVDAMTRVGRYEIAQRQQHIQLYAVRNEYEPFQIVVQAQERDLTDVSIMVSALHSPGESIDAAAIKIYREHYVAVTHASPLSPLPPTWIPDALIPIGHPTTGEDLANVQYDAQPFTIAGGENQPYWFDLYVAPETKPGEYSGTVTVSAANAAPVHLQLSLTVGPGILPTTPSQYSSFGLSPQSLQEQYQLYPSDDPARYYALWQAYGDLLLAHRLMPTPLPAVDYDIDPRTGAVTFSDYEMPGLGIRPQANLVRYLEQKGVNAIQLSTADINVHRITAEDRAKVVNQLGTLATLLHQQSSLPFLLYVYPVDEPQTPKAYETVRLWAALIAEVNATYGTAIQLLLTAQPRLDAGVWSELLTLVDIWVPCCSEVWRDMEKPRGPRSLAEHMAQGDMVWWYTALVQPPPAWMAAQEWPFNLYAGYTPIWLLDYPPMNYRIASWVNQHYGFTGLLYWATTNWSTTPDVWHDAGTYHVDDRTMNGEGLLIYPGEVATVGFDGPIASMRLKWLRESMEDYEYIALLEKSGQGAYAWKVLGTVVRAVDDWTLDPRTLYRARRQLGERLPAP